MRRLQSWTIQRWLIAAIVFTAFMVRVIGIQYGLPYPFMSAGDEIHTVIRALGFGTGDLNPHFFRYPSLYIYVLFFLYGVYYFVGLAGGYFQSADAFARQFFADPSAFYLIGRLVASLAGTATVYLVYLIGKRLYGVRVGVVAAVFLTFAPQHAQFSHMVKTQVPAGFLAALALIFVLNVYRNGRTRDYALGGLFSGLSMATNYTGVFLVLPLLLAHCFNVAEARGGVTKMLFDIKGWLGMAFLLIGFLIAVPFALLDSASFVRDIRGTANLYTLVSPYRDGSLLYYPVSFWNTMGPGAALLSLMGFFYAVYRRDKLGLLLLTFPIVVILFYSYFPNRSDYQMIPLFPFLVVIAARVLIAIFDNFKTSPQFRNVLFAMAVVGSIVMPAYQIWRWDFVHSQEDTRTLAKAWVEQNIPTGSKILLDSGKYFVGTLGVPLNDSKENHERRYREALEPANPGESFFEGERYTRYSNEATYYRYLAETVSEPTYNLVRMTHDDFVDYTDLQSLDAYRSAGVQYVILVSTISKIYLLTDYPHRAKAAKYLALYDSLEREAILLRDFSASAERPGPTVRIFKLSNPPSQSHWLLKLRLRPSRALLPQGGHLLAPQS